MNFKRPRSITYKWTNVAYNNSKQIIITKQPKSAVIKKQYAHVHELMHRHACPPS